MKLDREKRYSVRGWDGIAFRISGFPERWEPDMMLVECDEGTCDCHEDQDALHEVEGDDGEWFEQDESCGRVIVVMIGDDRKYEVDTDDLNPLGDDEYCGSCGQIGCNALPH